MDGSRSFGGDPGIAGKTIQINGIARTVAGVLPRDFISPLGQADVYFAMSVASMLRDPVSARGSHYLALIGRLKPGA